MRPGALDIGAKRDELPPLRLAKRWRTPRDQGRDVPLDLGDRLQGLVPSALQLASDEPVGWIDGIVLASGMGGLITRLLQRELQLPFSRGGLARLGLDRLDRSFYTERLQDAQHLLGDRCVHAQPAYGDASRRAVVRACAIALVAAELAAIVDMEFASAGTAAQKPRQQQFAFTGSSASQRAGHAGRIIGDCLEVAFELIPADVSLVMVLDQNVPFRHRPVHAAPDALAAVRHADPACCA